MKKQPEIMLSKAGESYLGVKSSVAVEEAKEVRAKEQELDVRSEGWTSCILVDQLII